MEFLNVKINCGTDTRMHYLVTKIKAFSQRSMASRFNIYSDLVISLNEIEISLIHLLIISLNI